MTVMTEKARTYAIVLYELGIPGQMVEGAVSIFKESPQLVRTLKSPVVPVNLWAASHQAKEVQAMQEIQERVLLVTLRIRTLKAVPKTVNQRTASQRMVKIP